MSEDLLGLIVIAAVVAFMGLLCVAKIRRHNPHGDKCGHGVGMPEGSREECAGDEPALPQSAAIALASDRPVIGSVDRDGRVAFRHPE